MGQVWDFLLPIIQAVTIAWIVSSISTRAYFHRKAKAKRAELAEKLIAAMFAVLNYSRQTLERSLEGKPQSGGIGYQRYHQGMLDCTKLAYLARMYLDDDAAERMRLFVNTALELDLDRPSEVFHSQLSQNGRAAIQKLKKLL